MTELEVLELLYKYNLLDKRSTGLTNVQTQYTSIDYNTRIDSISRALSKVPVSSSSFNGEYSSLTGIPSTFTPEAHTHLWTDVIDKPSTYPPSSHTHSANEITGLPIFISVIKTADEERVSSTNYTQDAHLVVTLEANSVYRLEIMLLYTAGTAEDMRFRVERTGLSDADLRFTGDLDASNAATLTWNNTTNCAGNGTTSIRMGNYIGRIITGIDTGDLSINWGQQVSGTTITTMLAGSMLLLRKLI